MTLMKSLLLGSAATLVVVAGAQAADLPTKKGAPAAQYVKICNIDGMAGFVLPGSDTCFKITGYMTAQVEAGNLTQGYEWGAAGVHGNQSSGLVEGAAVKTRDAIGYTTRGELEFIAKTNTAYGVLTSDIDTQFNYGSGFDNTGTGVVLNHGFITWAGFTLGKANSFFDTLGGGEGWANIFSADRHGYAQPPLMAYTATFGGGFSATLSFEDPRVGAVNDPTAGTIGSGSSSTQIAGNSTYLGMRAPDIVGAIDLAQGWGSAHLGGVAHNVVMGDALGNDINKWGWAVDGSVKFKLDSFGAGDNIQIQGSWSQNAVWYSGLPGAMWDEGGMVNGNGIAMPFADAWSNYDGSWATPTAWSIEATAEFYLDKVFAIDPEIGYGELHWTGMNGNVGYLAANSESWMGGAVFHWDPVAHLDFALELLYQNTHQSTPTCYGFASTTRGCGAAIPGTIPWHANTDGLEGRFMVTRDF